MKTLLLLCCSMVALADGHYANWVNYTVANGMPADKVTSVAIDGQHVWAGTANGLVLLTNGHIERVFSEADGLPNRFVSGVAVEPKTGDVWIATFGGLSQYSGGHFHNFRALRAVWRMTLSTPLDFKARMFGPARRRG